MDKTLRFKDFIQAENLFRIDTNSRFSSLFIINIFPYCNSFSKKFRRKLL